jgi:toxin ParE1/3/4
LFRITKTVQAEQDLDEIWFYIAKDNTAAADTFLDEIGDSAQLLAREPLMGRARPDLAPDLRSFPVARYVIFYTPSPSGVEIARVLHSARDIAPMDFEARGNA